MAKNNKMYMILGAVVLALLGYYAWQNWYNWTNPSIIPPECLQAGSIITCCYDINMTLIPCHQATGGLAVYQGTPGVYYIKHGVRVENTGNTNLRGNLTTVASTPDARFGNYFTTNGLTNSLKDIIKGANGTWITPPAVNPLYIGDVATGTYTITANVCANALLPDNTVDPNIMLLCHSTSGMFTIEKEALGFSIYVAT